MKVCKFDKIEDEDKINRIIKYIINENPYVIAIPPLLPLEEKAREISIGWFREDNETVRSAIKSIEYYCYARVDRLTANVELQRNIKEIISTRIKNMYAWTENKADLLIDKTIRAEIYRLSADLLTHCLQAQGFRSKMFDSGTFVQIDKEKNFNIPLIRESVQQYTQQNRDIDIFVIPLSLCKNIYGEIDFLSEKQNDYYATVLAASFNAEEIILSSDFKNVHTDTHSSREQHSLTYDEAENLIGSGVHLLYADSITLAARSNMVMRLVEPTHFNNERLYISSHDSGKSIKSLSFTRFTHFCEIYISPCSSRVLIVGENIRHHKQISDKRHFDVFIERFYIDDSLSQPRHVAHHTERTLQIRRNDYRRRYVGHTRHRFASLGTPEHRK